MGTWPGGSFLYHLRRGAPPPTVPFHTCVDCALHPCALWVCGPYVWPPAVCTPHSAWLAPSLPSPPRCKLRSHCHWDLKYLHPRRKSTHLVPLGTHEQVEPGVDPPATWGAQGTIRPVAPGPALLRVPARARGGQRRPQLPLCLPGVEMSGLAAPSVNFDQGKYLLGPMITERERRVTCRQQRGTPYQGLARSKAVQDYVLIPHHH